MLRLHFGRHRVHERHRQIEIRYLFVTVYVGGVNATNVGVCGDRTVGHQRIFLPLLFAAPRKDRELDHKSQNYRVLHVWTLSATEDVLEFLASLVHLLVGH